MNVTLIFLDVDGVLNRRVPIGHISPRMLTHLRTLVEATRAAIVLSSMWRLTKDGRRQLRQAFLAAGLPRPVSYTPCIDDGHARTAEILWWLRHNTDALDNAPELAQRDFMHTDEFQPRHHKLQERLHVTHFVALDDLDLRRPRRGAQHELLTEGHFVRTHGAIGLTETNVTQAKALLLPPPPPPPKTTTTTTTTNTPVYLVAATHCEHCGENGVRVEDRDINKFFCRADCWREFYACHGFLQEQL